MQSQSGTLLAERPPAAMVVVAPPAVRLPALKVWAWRVAIALAVLVALVGMLAFSSSPPT